MEASAGAFVLISPVSASITVSTVAPPELEI